MNPPNSSSLPWRFLLTGLVLLASGPASAQLAADKDTRLLANFEHSPDADFARGSAGAISAPRTDPLVPGRFGKGVRLAERESIELDGTGGNFDPARGTIEFWVKTDWAGSDPETHRFFTCAVSQPPNQYLHVNFIGKGRLGIALGAGPEDDWRWRRADADISGWQPGEWHHVAFTWDNGRLAAFADGEPGEQVDDGHPLPGVPEVLHLSGDGTAVIDGLRISGRVFTVEDARRSMAAAADPPVRCLANAIVREKIPGLMTRRSLLGGREIPLMNGGKTCPNLLAGRPGTSIEYSSEPFTGIFEAEVGVDDQSPANAELTFRVEVPGQGESVSVGPMMKKDGLKSVRLAVKNAGNLKLTIAGDEKRQGAAGLWIEPILRREDAEAPPSSLRELKRETVEMYSRQMDADRYGFEIAAKPDQPCLVARSFLEDDIDPDLPPAATDLDHPLEAFAARGESEPLSFTVYAGGEDLGQVEVSLDDLVCGEARLPAGGIDIRLVLRGLMRKVYTVPPENSKVVSRFLLHNRPVDIPAGTFRQYLLTVEVPGEAAPGLYRGQVKIRPANAPSRTLPVAFEVLPFQLRPLDERGYGVYYRFPSGDDWSHVERELADIRAHGANTLVPNAGVDFEMAGDVPEPDFRELERVLTLLRQQGYHGPLPVHSGAEAAARLLKYDPVKDYADVPRREAFFAAVAKGMRGLKELGTRFGEFEFLPTHMDEVFNNDRMERYIRLTEAVRQVPGFRIYITLHNSPRRDAGEYMKKCDPFVDVRCFNGHVMEEWLHAGHTWDDLRRELEASGDEAWTYHNIRGNFFAAEWSRLVNGLWMWTGPVRNHVPWMYYSIHGNPLDDTDGPGQKGHDFALAAPDPEDPERLVSTRHWECYREGIDDMRYLRTLESLIAEKPDLTAARAAREWLETLRRDTEPLPGRIEAIETESPYLVWLAEKFDGAGYRQLRRELADRIVELSR